MAKKWYMKKQWYDHGGVVSAGDRAEEAFKKVAENNGWGVTKATKSQDIFQHWDYYIESYDFQHHQIEAYRVDVKARKKLSRRDQDYCDDWAYVEFMLPGGGPGWLYRETTDLIAFETPDDFLIVEREKLRILAECLVNRGVYVQDAHDAKYKLYRRRDLEQVSLLETHLIRGIAKWIWPKDQKAWYSKVTDETIAQIKTEQ